MSYGDPDPIIGETLVAVEFNREKDELTFICVGGRYTYTTEGECCSTSWIEHLTIPPNIVGAKITGKTEPELPSFDGTPEGSSDQHEDLKIYHTAWQTDHGEVIAEYRNSSNGYYGGWMNGPEVTNELLPH
jgi:hypothetical protein